MINDEFYMEEALKEAKLAALESEVPVGAIIVLNGEIISRGHNTRKKDNSISHHAEINAIECAEAKFGYLPLFNATIYVTLEPCPMCAYAIMDAHISKVVYGTSDPNKGAITKLDIFNKSLGSKVEVCGNIKQEECSKILIDWFKDKR